MFTKEMLKQQLKDMGIQADDTVLIHTSLRAVGAVENGADGIIDVFKEYLSEGLFLVPTHTWDSVTPKQPVYDVRKEVPCIGTLPTVAAFRKDGIRSLHPTHSMWACGKGAEEFIKNEENAPTPGMPGYAWSRLADVHAKILLIGVSHNKNTFIHSVEESADIPDRLMREPYEVTICDWDGNCYSHPYRTHSCSQTNDVSRFYVNFDPMLTSLGVQTFGRFGNAEVRVVDAAKCKKELLKLFAKRERDLCVDYMDIPAEWYQ